MAKKSKPNELTLTRLYDASVELVWSAWTDAKQAAHWWGPRGFTITTHSKDLKVGGHWHYTMHGPDGTDYPNKTIYLEVEEQKKLVYDHGGYDDRPPLFRVTVTFEPVGQKTRMEMTMAFESAQVAVEMKKFIKMANGNSTWDRLAEYLEKDNSGKEIFVINNSFPAPVEKIFEMWTNPQLAELWRPPFEKTSDLKIEKNTALEYTMSFSGLQMKVFTFLAEEEPQQTRVTVVCEPVANLTQKPSQNFISQRPALHQAWSQSFDRLEERLTKNATPL